MKNQFRCGSVILQYGVRLFACGLVAVGSILHAQETVAIDVRAGSPGGTNFLFRTGGPGRAGALFINGSDIGTILLKACDLDQDGKLTLTELKQMAAASCKLWDTNADGSVSQSEFSAALKEFFPAPPPGAARGMRVMNGVAQSVSAEELPSPDVILSRRIFAAADSNKDGLLSLQEINDFVDKSFAQWDQSGNGSLDAEELNTAFGQLAMPDDVFNAPVQ